ncbi:MAG: hypothetical protein IE921_11255 [Rhodobacteraceae bacterium]|nr:hypothetical protein [Paracoccaceae bacterium]
MLVLRSGSADIAPEKNTAAFLCADRPDLSWPDLQRIRGRPLFSTISPSVRRATREARQSLRSHLNMGTLEGNRRSLAAHRFKLEKEI